MQGDPDNKAIPIETKHVDQMVAAARAWASKKYIDNTENLERQTVWLFNGYNDGIIKQPVTDALFDWYSSFVPRSQIFYKDNLPAAHAQISASCGARAGACQLCDRTGGTFINFCQDITPDAKVYDAAGAALQMFYGPLVY